MVRISTFAGRRLAEAPRGLQAGQLRHLHVHQDDVGPEAPRLLDRLASVRRLAHDLDHGLARRMALIPARKSAWSSQIRTAHRAQRDASLSAGQVDLDAGAVPLPPGARGRDSRWNRPPRPRHALPHGCQAEGLSRTRRLEAHAVVLDDHHDRGDVLHAAQDDSDIAARTRASARWRARPASAGRAPSGGSAGRPRGQARVADLDLHAGAGGELAGVEPHRGQEADLLEHAGPEVQDQAADRLQAWPTRSGPPRSSAGCRVRPRLAAPSRSAPGRA